MTENPQAQTASDGCAIMAFANQKGGVGKTTCCVNLAASLAAANRRVLLVDLDPQGNATMGSGVNKQDLAASTTEVLLQEVTLAEGIVPSKGGYDICPTNGDLTAAEIQLVSEERGEQRLRSALNEVTHRYDFIFLDCPPTLNMLTINALVAARSVVVPMQCEYYALEGLTSLLETIERVRSTHNPELHLEGLLRTMFDGRNRLTQEVSAQLHQHFDHKVFRTVIPRNVRLAEAPSYGVPVLLHDKHSLGAKAFLALAGELLRRREHQEKPVAEMVD